MSEKKISILIANFNNGHFFQDCYDSLIAQTDDRWEAIIIDDASTDDSVKTIEAIIKADERFKFYQNETNLGYQSTIAKAITLTETPYFGRLDPDDALTENAIEECLRVHEQFPEAGLVYSNHFLCDENLKIVKTNKGAQIENKIFFNGEVLSFASLKKSIYLETAGIDVKNRRAEDKDIYLKMSEIAPVKHIDAALYLYRIHQGGVSSTNDRIDKSYFWYWVAIIKAAERRQENVEDEFLNKFVRRYKYKELKNNIDLLKKNRWIKLGAKLGLVKIFKDL